MQQLSRRGFTLIETIVTVSIISIVSIALSGAIAYFYRSNAFILEQTSAVDSAHRGIDEAFRLLREASYGEDGSYPLIKVATSSITFFSDVDHDMPVEKVEIYLVDTTFYQVITSAAGNPPSYAGQPGATTTIATWVKNATSTPIFRYFDSEGAELMGTIDITQVASVKTRLDVDINPQRAPNILTLEASATLRNLRYEL